ncbi:hypothetical protein [Thermomonas sp.]|uniref:hypothetical protein n=1 Tax=Thermomonas sp. TaxID=1971895 RepID=UPI001ED7772E|nr:hypothetical protein [Thermomonas sp.]MBK6416275.1 hypothetical protein [Thermomonas sp.]
MTTNLDKYKADLQRLIDDGPKISAALLREAWGEEKFRKQVLADVKNKKKEAEEFIAKLPPLKSGYQAWYSESLAVIKQLLPDRLDDFKGHYEKPRNRKELTAESYRIEDALQGLRTSYAGETRTDASTAYPHLEQQRAILKSVQRRFESSLFEITQLVQADLFDSELDAAKELLKNKFGRAAGAIAGVVLEKHLAQVCVAHNVKIAKKHPGIADLNEALKSSSIIDVPQWRFIQHLADIRNLCDHNKSSEPTTDQVADLISGVAKVSKTVF